MNTSGPRSGLIPHARLRWCCIAFSCLEVYPPRPYQPALMRMWQYFLPGALNLRHFTSFSKEGDSVDCIGFVGEW